MTVSNPISTEPGPLRPLKNDEQVTSLALSVLYLFSECKTLFEVAQSALQDAFDERFPDLGVTARNAAILEPQWPENEDEKRIEGYQSDRLTDLLLDRCRGVPARRYSPASFLMTDAGSESSRKIDVALDEILQMLDEWGALLLQCYQQHLTELWDQPYGGTNAWQQLSDLFKETLRRDCTQLSSEEAATVQAVLEYPDTGLRERELGYDTTQAAITFVYEEVNAPTRDDVMVLSMNRQLGERTIALLYTLSGGIEIFVSVEAREKSWMGSAKSWGSRLRNYTPDNDIFDALTLCLLERQLRVVEAIKAPDFVDLASLELHLAQVCSPAALLGAFRSGHEVRLSTLQALLPAWLQEAALADRSAYSKLLSSLADVNREGTFLTGIPAIVDYADETLSNLIMADDPSRGEVCAGDFKVTLRRNTNSGFEIVDPPFPAPRYTSTTKTFAQLALQNLDAFPFVPSQINYRGAKPPAWATYDYLRALTTRADIGKNYPELLQRKLLDDPDESSLRRGRFSESLRITLPLLALELKIKNRLTLPAYQGLVAVLRPSVSARQVAGRQVIVRPLAFQVRADATADVVSNMFVIGPEDVTQGPHVLYRPALNTPLLEFASYAELFAAIKQSGDVQNSVLAGLSAGARSTYANGGFEEPHIARVIVGDFDTLSVPPPALLSSTPLHGDVCNAMYQACAQALIDQAKIDSVSDAESRWIGLKQFGWATFNVLLPLARGPVAAVGLLGPLLVSIETVVKSENGENRWSAFAEMLMNLALVLIHAGSPFRRIPPIAGAAVSEVEAAVDNVVHKPRETGLASPPFGGKARLFYGWHGARSRFSAKALVNLDTFKMPGVPLGSVEVTTGQYGGLYQRGSRMFGRVGGSWYEVAAKLEGVVIVDFKRPTRSGPWLRRDGQGRWDFEYRPRLLGGAGLSVRAARRLQSLKKKGRDLLDGFQKQLANARKEDRSGRPAADIEGFILEDARKFEECAQGIWQISQSLDDAQTYALIDQLKDRATQLREQARITRIKVLVARAPTPGALEYLLQENVIRIRQVGVLQDFSTSNGPDFLQEYEIRGADGKALWYAHFHYLKRDAVPADFSKAHLKTLEQRKQGLGFQKAQQQAGQRVVPIWRENLSSAVAEKIFAASRV